MADQLVTDTDSDVSDLDPQQLSESAVDKWAPQLGYAEDPETPMTPDQFPSKSGGLPAWLNPEHVLTAEDVQCKNCDEPMILLLQLYTPEDHPEEAFHRAIYVFCCKSGGCLKQNWQKSLKVFRSQLPRINPYYPPPPLDDEEGSENQEGVAEETASFTRKEFKAPLLCVICGLAGPKRCSECNKATYCSQNHQNVDWNMCGHKEFCKRTPTNAEEGVANKRRLRLFVEKEIVSEPESKPAKEKDIETSQDPSSSTGSGMSQALVPVGDETYENTEVEVDDAFLKFQKRIDFNPDQVIRYDRVEYDMPEREPLWVHDSDKPTLVPNCEKCNGPRTFELQILSTLLNYLGVSHVATDSLDWGSLYIYSCKHNCPLGEGVYGEEFIWKQDFSADGMRLAPKEGSFAK